MAVLHQQNEQWREIQDINTTLGAQVSEWRTGASLQGRADEQD
jgi:hypothetical protein